MQMYRVVPVTKRGKCKDSYCIVREIIFPLDNMSDNQEPMMPIGVKNWVNTNLDPVIKKRY